jgi:hypothetical protein
MLPPCTKPHARTAAVLGNELDAGRFEGTLYSGERGPDWQSRSAFEIGKRSFANTCRLGEIGARDLKEGASRPALSSRNRRIYAYVAGSMSTALHEVAYYMHILQKARRLGRRLVLLDRA